MDTDRQNQNQNNLNIEGIRKRHHNRTVCHHETMVKHGVSSRNKLFYIKRKNTTLGRNAFNWRNKVSAHGDYLFSVFSSGIGKIMRNLWSIWSRLMRLLYAKVEIKIHSMTWMHRSILIHQKYKDSALSEEIDDMCISESKKCAAHGLDSAWSESKRI